MNDPNSFIDTVAELFDTGRWCEAFIEVDASGHKTSFYVAGILCQDNTDNTELLLLSLGRTLW